MSDARTDHLLALVSVSQDDLFRYIYSLVPHRQDAQDILQETILAIGRKFDEYDTSRPFLAWAGKFAYYKVLQYRERNCGRLKYFAPEVLELLANDRDSQAHLLQSRLAALDHCLKKLPPPDRSLLRNRYELKFPLEELAAEVNQSRRTVVRNLKRIRDLLYDCIERNSVLADEL